MKIGLSRRDYDCIASVSTLSAGGWPARVKDVAARMHVSPPTAVEFLEKLKGVALVEKGPSGYRLTKEGLACSNEATRAHRLLETLLVRSGMPLELACRVSSSVGVPIAEEDLEKLCANMQHPDTCPHGRPIPFGGSHV
ncbi:MAG: metal-dependent transcriptional regulator [Nitrososphaerota archaeon]|nr:metal-dependent transcriptional regulator [Nitrososphaerota archaeon]MDG6989837.1 metal-dependent transcriptional regulator [Nitrososphaerota archaeon]